MKDIKFLQDYRGHLTQEQYYTAGTVATFSDAIAAQLVKGDRAEYHVIVADVATKPARARSKKA